MWARAFASIAMIWSAAAAAGPPLQPTQPWVVNFADTQCSASRNYGTKDEPLYLVLKAPPVGEVLQIAVLKKATQASAVQSDAVLTVDSGPALETSMLSYQQHKPRLRTHLLNVPTDRLSQLGQAKLISIKSGTRVDETFAVTSMAALLKTLERCVADLRRVWNVTDGADSKSPLAEHARGNLAKYFQSEDYPWMALASRQQGAVKVVILVNEAGKVADCTVVETSGVASLDSQTCAVILERAEFKPARTNDGRPAKEAFFQTIRWAIAR